MGRSEKIKKTLFSKGRIIKEILENMKKYIIFFLLYQKIYVPLQTIKKLL